MAGELIAPLDAGGRGGLSFAATVVALAIGQLLNWAAPHHDFSSFLLLMMRAVVIGMRKRRGCCTWSACCSVRRWP